MVCVSLTKRGYQQNKHTEPISKNQRNDCLAVSRCALYHLIDLADVGWSVVSVFEVERSFVDVDGECITGGGVLSSYRNSVVSLVSNSSTAEWEEGTRRQ